MAVIALSKPQKIQKAITKVSKDTKRDCLDFGIKNKEIAQSIGVDPSAISHQFRKNNITLETYIAVQVLKEEKGANVNENQT